MIQFPLALTLAPGPVHRPAAWFIPGADPEVWLQEVALWRVAMADLRFYVVPASSRSRDPVGVLVDLPAGVAPQGILRAQPYGRLADRFYLPSDAALQPAVTEAELNSVLLHDVMVLHPSAGLIGFGREEALRASDLIEAPPQRPMAWGLGRPGGFLRDKLLAVEATETPGFEDILASARDDIGSSAPDLLPRSPEKSRVGSAAKWIAMTPLALVAMAGLSSVEFLRALGKLLPAGRRPASQDRAGKGVPGKPGRLENLRLWFAEKAAAISKSLLESRQSELERLRQKLQADPDEGLRYAIPLRSLGTRGRAPPGGRLSRRDPAFNLSKLFSGGQAADPWALPPDMLASLSEHYRKAANRELNLGRFRRAAYVFAELLGDFTSAAGALERGRHFREAAVLYKEQLKNPRKAAECLEQGGLLIEAVALYAELELFEKAGALYTLMGRPDDAVRCYRAQVEIFLTRSDFLGAADLLEHELKSPDEALETLTSAWPQAQSAGACLEESFNLLGRLARHDEAELRLHKFRGAPPPPDRAAILTLVLAHVATIYPEANIRSLGADATRIVAGNHLATTGPSDRAAMARAVGSLVPRDRLLSRDVDRFLAKRASTTPNANLATPTRQDPVVLRKFSLPASCKDWKAAASEGDGFYALGTPISTGVAIVRGLWDGRTVLGFASVKSADTTTINWALHPMPGTRQMIVTPAVIKTPRTFASNIAFGGPMEVGRPGWLEIEGLLGLCHNENSVTWVLRAVAYQGLVLCAHRSEDGLLLATHAVNNPPPLPDGGPELVARGDQVYASWGSAILRMGSHGIPRIEPLHRPVRHLAVSAPHTYLRVAAAMDEGGMVFWGDGRSQSFGEGLFEPLITFTRGGMLVAADSLAGRIYATDRGSVRRRGDFTFSGGRPISLLSTNKLDEFAALTSDGAVTVFKIPG
ncbi:MAG TPA: hypothetical protein VG269_24715 [Tepidisphaeraceae bacterium]|jgi:tetratricopeptide (TPR) repeat protein|nr:hypothetical protein [Tepidisphaeraceae bacterium]